MRINVCVLTQRQRVTLHASLHYEKGALFRAHARYCTAASGELDLNCAGPGQQLRGARAHGAPLGPGAREACLKVSKARYANALSRGAGGAEGQEPERGCPSGRGARARFPCARGTAGASAHWPGASHALLATRRAWVAGVGRRGRREGYNLINEKVLCRFFFSKGLYFPFQ